MTYTPAPGALLRDINRKPVVPNKGNTSMQCTDWVTDLCVQIWKHMSRKLLKTVQTMTIFGNPLADPPGNPPRTPFGPRNRCVIAFTHVYTY